jgi:hypothetical protein
VVIYTDNQAAIRLLAKPKGRSGAYLLKTIARKIQELQDDGLPTEIYWIPAHKGIPGNEAADRAAKEATGWRKSGKPGPKADISEELFTLKATLKTWIHKEANRRWASEWQNETKGRSTRKYTPEPTKRILRMHENLTKRQSAILVQMRTGKIGLNDFLFSRRVPGILRPECECGEGRQTVDHVLLRCRKHDELRNRKLGYLRGRGDLRKILNEHKPATKAIKFMEQTQILKHYGNTKADKQN